MISPTGGRPRGVDNYGSGAWGAGRGNRKHLGVDYICVPSQQIYAPIAGKIVREARPYASDDYSGCLIEGEHMHVKIFYMTVADNLIGRFVEQGQAIGFAQDITLKYPGITPHVHLQVESIDPAIFTEML